MMSKTSPILIKRRREKVRTLMARGLSAPDILRSLTDQFSHLSQATVERDMAHNREENAKWYLKHISLDARAMDYFKEEVDHLREVRKQSWQAWQDAIEKKDSKKEIAALNCLINSSKALIELLGFTGVSISDLEVLAEIKELKKEADSIKKLAEVAHAPSNEIKP